EIAAATFLVLVKISERHNLYTSYARLFNNVEEDVWEELKNYSQNSGREFDVIFETVTCYVEEVTVSSFAYQKGDAKLKDVIPKCINIGKLQHSSKTSPQSSRRSSPEQ
uniref:RB_A domain-containing protein n=1 Tax=Steinernema glaseri TaxID=37863 RepID=A0A1I8AAX3_9BILA